MSYARRLYYVCNYCFTAPSRPCCLVTELAEALQYRGLKPNPEKSGSVIPCVSSILLQTELESGNCVALSFIEIGIESHEKCHQLHLIGPLATLPQPHIPLQFLANYGVTGTS